MYLYLLLENMNHLFINIIMFFGKLNHMVFYKLNQLCLFIKRKLCNILTELLAFTVMEAIFIIFVLVSLYFNKIPSMLIKLFSKK